jgi:Trk K+ transport system NAD-binding subunit
MEGGSRIVVCGSDHLTIRVVEELQALGGEVVVVMQADSGPLAARVRDWGLTPVVGDYREEGVLHQAGLPRARGVALLEDDDVSNLHAALAAHEIAPEARLAVRMFNLDLGQQLETLFEECRMMSSSELAAPAFADAVLTGRTGQRLSVLGRVLELRELPPDDPSLVAPLGPGRDSTVLGLVELGEEEVASPARTPVEPDRMEVGARAVRTLFDRRLLWLLAALVATLAVSGVVFTAFHDLSLIDALYFTVVTITTTGYGDINLLEADAALKAYGIGVMLLGALILAVLFGLVTDAIVGVRLARALGERPRPERDHVIVCGLGSIGYRVVERLCERGVPCIAVDRDEQGRFVTATRTLGVPVVVADASQPETLSELNIERARGVMCMTSDDVANLRAALAVRTSHPGVRVVLRLFDPDLADRVAHQFGIEISRSVTDLAAPSFASALLEREVLGTFAVGARAQVVAQLEVPGDSPLAGETVAGLEERFGARVLSAGGRWRPPPQSEAKQGDLVVVAPRPALAELTRALEGAAT